MSDGLVVDDVALAVRRLLDGGLVAIPTETVYGLAAVADHEAAVNRIFEVKGRPAGHPLIVHIADMSAIEGWAAEVPPAAAILADACWPGPLTLLLPRGRRVLDVVTGGRSAVAIRVPAHPMTTELLDQVGAVVAPSANVFGRVSPTTAEHVLADLGARLDPARDAILDGGPSPVGVESTIVDCTVDPAQVLRPGGIATEDVHRLLAGAVGPAHGERRASGMLASHYAPACRVELVEDAVGAEQRRVALSRSGERAAVLDLTGDLVQYARDLYAELRHADECGLDALIAVLPPPGGLGHAIRDRLMKAAAAHDRPDPNPAG